MNIWLPCVPPTATAQQKRHTRSGISFDPPEVVAATQFLTGLLSPYSPALPMTRGVRAKIRFVFPYRKGEKKSVTASGGLVPKLSIPDCDNAVKRLNDILARLRFFVNDSQIYSLHVEKFWGANPGIQITLVEDATQ